MKIQSAIRYILGMIIGMQVLMYSGCGGSDPAPGNNGSDTEEVRVRALLTAHQWKMQSVTVDGVNENDMFTGLTLQFTSTGFTAHNGEPVWPLSGTWTFTNEKAEDISRNDGVQVAINNADENQLILTLTWTETTLGSGREKSVEGEHVFTFVK